jgi:hypothetical protein
MTAVTIHDLRVLGESRVLAFDLIDILSLAETDAASSSWKCGNVECVGGLADELHLASNSGLSLSGSQLLRLAAGVSQIIDGDFEACRPGDAHPWLMIRAVDSTDYVVATNDESLIARVRGRFRDVRDSPDDLK